MSLAKPHQITGAHENGHSSKWPRSSRAMSQPLQKWLAAWPSNLSPDPLGQACGRIAGAGDCMSTQMWGLEPHTPYLYIHTFTRSPPLAVFGGALRLLSLCPSSLPSVAASCPKLSSSCALSGNVCLGEDRLQEFGPLWGGGPPIFPLLLGQCCSPAPGPGGLR